MAGGQPLHPLLLRQLARAGVQDAPSAPWQAFLERVSRTYADADQERYTSERAMQISSREMQALHDELRTAVAAGLKDAARVRAVVHAIGDGLRVTDAAGRVVFANEIACSLLGRSESELLGSNILDGLLYGDATTTAAARADELLANLRYGVTTRIDEGYLLRSGSGPLAISFVLNPMHGSEGITGAVLVFRDRTQALRAHDQLVAAHARAEGASRAKSSFLATMSHEIRTPMNAVLGMLHELLATQLLPLQRECVETALTSGNTLLTLIGDILDYSKIEAGKLELETLAFELDQAIDEVVDLFADTASAKGLAFHCHIDPDVPRRVLGDPGRLRQIVTNFVSNALKFTRQGEIRIEVRREPGSPDLVRIAVTDTGIGIPVEKQGLLFQVFTQTDASTTRGFGGTGLGLAISRCLAGAMGGGVGLSSAPGVGSSFWCTVRLPTDPSTEAPLPMLGTHVVFVHASDRANISLRARLDRLGAITSVTGDAGSAMVALERLPVGSRALACMADADAVHALDALAAERSLADVTTIVIGHGRMVAESLSNHARFGVYVRAPMHGGRFIEKVRGTLLARGTNAAHGAASPAVRPLCVLVVEDNLVNQTVARRMLERVGHRVQVAANGIEALAALQQGSFDLVLMDCQMPEMDGYEAARRIRAVESAGDHVPIIALTANAMKGDRELCLAAGMDDYLTKPVRPTELMKTLSRWGGGDGARG